VQVSQDGPGVPADRLPRIFDRFYRAGAPARQPGSGLGLAIVTEIAATNFYNRLNVPTRQVAGGSWG
jgi:two-component system OmpR family sensor kinase